MRVRVKSSATQARQRSVSSSLLLVLFFMVLTCWSRPAFRKRTRVHTIQKSKSASKATRESGSSSEQFAWMTLGDVWFHRCPDCEACRDKEHKKFNACRVQECAP